LISSGVPVAIWLDRDCFEETKILSVCPKDLPRHVREKHKDAYDSDELGANIGLVWEDPNLVPFVSQSKLKMAGN